MFEGHAFIVEAAVSIGGKELKPGINVYRFANRIPLLFEGGSDVITRTATKRINWNAYKINQTTDKVSRCLMTRALFSACGSRQDFVHQLVGCMMLPISLSPGMWC